MKCPLCNQLASTWIRNSFTLQGVTFVQVLKGQLKCQHCGVLLRSARFGKQVWFGLATFAVMMTLMVLFSDALRSAYGMGAVALYWIVLVVMASLLFAYGTWKYAVLEVVKDEKTEKS